MGQIHVNFTDDLMSYYKCRCDSWMWASVVTRPKLSHPFTTCLMLDQAPRMHDSRLEQGKTGVGADPVLCGWIALSSLVQQERSQFLVERGCEVPHSTEAEKTRGVNKPCSTSMMRCSYFHFLAFSSHLKDDSRDDRLYDCAFGLKTLTSKNVHWQFPPQNPLARMSALALSSWLAEAKSRDSPSRGWRSGPGVTPEQTLARSFPVKSLISLCQRMGKVPLGQFRAW